MPGIHDQNLPQSFIEELKLKEENPEWNKHFEETLKNAFLPEGKGNRVESFVIKNEQANNDKANVTAAERFSNDFIYAKDGWHEIFQFCLACGMDRVLEQYPQEQHNTGIKAIKLFIHHLIGAKLESSGSL